MLQAIDGTHEQNTDTALSILVQFKRLSPEAIQKLQQVHVVTPQESLTLNLLLARAHEKGSLARLTKSLDEWTSSQFPLMLDIGEFLAIETLADDLPSLEHVGISRFPYLRRAAMLGVRRLRNKSSIPFLVRQLDFPDDRETQYLAVITLAEITGTYGEFAPGMGIFDKNPQKYVDLWKKWWADRIPMGALQRKSGYAS